MEPSLTDTLCTRCGLCCDGSLFADVELVGKAELARLEILGLDLEDSGTNVGLLSQPCAALRGRRCSIYAHRPKCCQTFECQLLQDVRRGAVPVDVAAGKVTEAHRRIRRVRDLLTDVGGADVHLPLKERCAEALAGEAGATQEVKRKRAELSAAMSAVETLIWQSFLGSGGSQKRR